MKKNTLNVASKTKSPTERKLEDIEDWRNEHGQPSFEYLQSLAKESSPASLEKLRSIATDLDVTYGPNTSAEELVRIIQSANRSDPNPTT